MIKNSIIIGLVYMNNALIGLGNNYHKEVNFFGVNIRPNIINGIKNILIFHYTNFDNICSKINQHIITLLKTPKFKEYEERLKFLKDSSQENIYNNVKEFISFVQKEDIDKKEAEIEAKKNDFIKSIQNIEIKTSSKNQKNKKEDEKNLKDLVNEKGFSKNDFFSLEVKGGKVKLCFFGIQIFVDYAIFLKINQQLDEMNKLSQEKKN